MAAPNMQNLASLPEKYGWPTKNARGYCIKEQPSGMHRPIRIIHLGAGASGICFAKHAIEELDNATWICYDKNHDIGGTWLENRFVTLSVASVSFYYHSNR